MEMVLGNKRSEGKRSNQKKERWGPTRNGGRSYGRPPLSPGGSHQSVPHWEKKFCTSICSVPWKRLCETQKLLYMYPEIVEWNDSEGEEAFRNAKARYWAEINHFPCPVPLPDPDMYIDSVDHNTVLDPELVEDLYKQPPLSQDGEGDRRIIWDSFRFTDETVPVTGWGDEDQVLPVFTTDQSIQIQPTGWGDEENQVPPIYATVRSTQIQPTGWGDKEDQVPPIYAAARSIQIEPTGWGDEVDQIPTIYTTDESILIQPTGWGDMEYPTNEISHKDLLPWNSSETDNYRDYQCGRDNSWHRGSADSYGAWKWQKSVS